MARETEDVTETTRRTVMDGIMYVMDGTGHKDVMRWSESEASRDIARKAFNDFKAKGYSMFVMDEDDEQGRKLDSFDPSVGAFIAVAPLRGG